MNESTLDTAAANNLEILVEDYSGTLLPSVNVVGKLSGPFTFYYADFHLTGAELARAKSGRGVSSISSLDTAVQKLSNIAKEILCHTREPLEVEVSSNNFEAWGIRGSILLRCGLERTLKGDWN